MTHRSHVLVVEDDPELRRSIERCLVREGFTTTAACDGREAIEKLEAGVVVDLVLTDLDMPRAGGREVLAAALLRRLPVVILTGQATVQTAVELMRLGAANFLTKPFTPASLRAVLEDCFGRAAPRTVGSSVVIGRDGAFQKVLDVIDSVAETDATILIRGESGTGKEVVARTIHAASRRAAAAFVAVNCGAIPEALLESELFGHARGAFTGATHSRAGRFQLAEGGTLFLDEIGDMPLGFQVKLLRVLQERQYEVLGESTSRSTDLRIIAASHRDLSRLVAEGEFREDLFYRLNVIELELPALRERRADIPLLVRHFLDAANERHARQVSGISPEVMVILEAHSWPGNVRQLANTIERMVVLGRAGTIGVEGLPPELRRAAPPVEAGANSQLPEGGLDLREAVASLEESLIEQALKRTQGNRNAAAQLLGLNRTTLVEKLKRKRT